MFQLTVGRFFVALAVGAYWKSAADFPEAEAAEPPEAESDAPQPPATRTNPHYNGGGY
jgi:hypothetical protein